MKLSLLLLLILALFVTSCGKGSSRSSKLKTRITEQQIENLMNGQVFDCNGINGKSCPEGIARLFVLDRADADNSGLCSGFMVDETTLVTNEHCISSQAVCNDTYVAIYTGHSYVQTKCESVKKIITDHLAPYDDTKTLDVAIVKVKDPYFGKTFKVSATRPKVNDDVFAWVVDHTGNAKTPKNLYESRITEFHCYVSPSTEWKALTLEKCPVIHGNSGSPILNTSGEVVGVIWGGTGIEDKATMDLDLRRSLDRKAAATEAIYFSSDLVN